MEFKLVHLSDIHFARGGHEKKPAFGPFVADLESELKSEIPTYLVLSGDIAFAGSQSDHYESLLEKLVPALNAVGITKERRICVPGNHDVASNVVETCIFEHEAIVASAFNEDSYNNFIDKPSEPFQEKFKNYLEFQSRFASYGISKGSLGGQGHSLPEGVGIYCANTAFFSSGAAKNNGVRVLDEGRLALATRSLAGWLDEASQPIKILVGHHPSSWLNQWSKSELRRLSKQFSLMMTGHLHDQDVFHSVEFGASVVHLAAPALLTDKRAPMGYAIVDMCSERGPISVKYRQWSQKSKFVLGTLMADNDAGVVELLRQRQDLQVSANDAYISRYYDSGLERALQSFWRIQKVWIEPLIKRVSETDRQRGSAEEVSVAEVISSVISMFIKAPPQYGLSCLGWMLCRDAVGASSRPLWLRVDLAVSKPHKVREDLRAQLKTFGGETKDVACIVVDSWTSSMNNSLKCLEAIAKEFPGVRLIVLETDDRPAIDAGFHNAIGRTFEQLYLWAAPRAGLRKIVKNYHNNKQDDVELERALTKLIGDLDVLNLPRTALNCLTILMVSEVEYDDLPINRAEVIKRILFLIFSSDISLTYRSRADVKDCEHLLGYFAEKVLKSGEGAFTRENFYLVGAQFCKEMLVDLDVRGVLSILVESGVIVDDGSSLRFRFSYWVYYFAALRMHHDQEFLNYILSDMQYTRFPQVIEFYTGFDRRRADAVSRLEADLTSLCDSVEKKCGLSTPAQLFAGGRWNPSEEDVERMRADIEERVNGSTLPIEIKDQFADRTYDPSRPYDQEIQSVMAIYSFNNLTAGVSAASRALRNSDYVGPEQKKRLLAAIMRCWEQIQMVLVLVTPSLANNGRASFDGTEFIMVDQPENERGDGAVGKIWSIVPYNVLSWFRGDISSAKMGPLLYTMLKSESVALTRHNLASLIVAIRPKGWKSVIQDYVAEIDKNSFFLWDMYTALDGEYQFNTLSDRSLSDVGELVKMSIAKHEKGSKRPSSKLISKYTINELEKDDNSES